MGGGPLFAYKVDNDNITLKLSELRGIHMFNKKQKQIGLKTAALMVAAVLSLGTLSACGKKTKPTESEASSSETTLSSETTVAPTQSETAAPTTTKKEETVTLKSAEGDEGTFIGVMIDNHPDARQQAGLNEADYVFEFWVEGTYTRYLAMFYSQKPEHIGPVRSARPYFIERMQEFDPLYVHVGGSSHAVQILRDGDYRDVDGMYTSTDVMWRNNSTGKWAPHNVYASWETLMDYAKNTGKGEPSKFTPYYYHPDVQTPDGTPASYVDVQATPGLVNRFEFDKESDAMLLYRNDKLALDEYPNEAIEIQNLIIQYAAYGHDEVNPNVRAVKQVGSGEGFYYSRGQYVPITWSKESPTAPTLYFVDGEPLILNPGLTWISVVDLDANVDFVS